MTAWFVVTVKAYDLAPAWVYYGSYSAHYFVEEMQSRVLQLYDITRVDVFEGCRTDLMLYCKRK